ncbi:MAG TPA: tRNA lysidine(34) synthetase TilS, partial [Phycisphaerae bacterium]|nr:tRNA lysidine(34) synthetase TilS [Phycisphaerae bacterium]
GAPGAKSVSDFLIDEKVEPAARSRTGLLCDQDGPVWIMPLRIDERVKLTPATQRALRVTLRPAKNRQVT